MVLFLVGYEASFGLYDYDERRVIEKVEYPIDVSFDDMIVTTLSRTEC